MPALLYFFALCHPIIAIRAFGLGGILEPVSYNTLTLPNILICVVVASVRGVV